MNNIDMHIHTTASDGVLKPSEVVKWAIKLGLRGVAITDHDTIDGIEEGILESKNYNNFLVIPGIEFSTLYGDEEVHVLGYFIDYKRDELIKITNKIKSHRLNRGKKIVEKLIALGYDINFSEVQKIANDGVIGRPHIGRILVNKGYVASMEEAFDKILKKGKPAYVERYKITLEEAVEIVEKSDGIPILAHPGLITNKINIETILTKGIKGIEVYHSKHSELDSKYYLNLATKHDLFVTGGSDYHEGMINDVPTIGSVSVSLDSISGMKKS